MLLQSQPAQSTTAVVRVAAGTPGLLTATALGWANAGLTYTFIDGAARYLEAEFIQVTNQWDLTVNIPVVFRFFGDGAIVDATNDVIAWSVIVYRIRVGQSVNSTGEKIVDSGVQTTDLAAIATRTWHEITTSTITASNLAVGDVLNVRFTREGANAADTLGINIYGCTPFITPTYKVPL